MKSYNILVWKFQYYGIQPAVSNRHSFRMPGGARLGQTLYEIFLTKNWICMQNLMVASAVQYVSKFLDTITWKGEKDHIIEFTMSSLIVNGLQT